MNPIKQSWAESKTYRALLIAAILYALLRFAVQVSLFAYSITPQAVEEGTLTSADLQFSYIPAAEHFRDREDIYLKGSLEILETHFPYTPAFAFLYGPLLLLPIRILVWVMTAIHLVAYYLLYVRWARIFQKYRLTKAEKLWAQTLPLFIIFTVFWDDLALLNIYLIVALFATFAIEAVLDENLGWASFWIGAVILPIKPHWAFALGIPLLLGRYRFFLRLMLGTLLAYLATVVVTILGGGADYVLRQYQDYFIFLSRLSRDFPWWGPDKPFLGYNHSVMQTILYYFGVTDANKTLASIVKLALLVPLGLVALKYLRNPIRKSGREVPETALALGFALYLGAFLWLDMVWEISLGLVIFVFLLTIIEQKWIRTALWILFFPYAALDIWRLISYLAFGDSILYAGVYVTTDPILYVPWILALIIIFYGLLIRFLSNSRPSLSASST
ncbi:MAG: glycosyltransferase 87 family protein [Anaerolineales bacterium]